MSQGDWIAVLPFSAGRGGEIAALLALGVALEFNDWLNTSGDASAVITPKHVDDDGRAQHLVFYRDPPTPERAVEAVEAVRESGMGDAEGAPVFRVVVSGLLDYEGGELRVAGVATDVPAVYVRGCEERVLRPEGFAGEAAALFIGLAESAGAEKAVCYEPGAERLESWRTLLMVRALTLAASIEHELPKEFLDEILKDSLEALEAEPGFTKLRDRLGELALVLVLEKGSSPDPFLRLFDKIERKTGGDWRLFFTRGELLAAADRHEAAAKMFCRVVAGDKQAPEPQTRCHAALSAGHAFHQAGRHDEAVRVLQRAMASEELKIEAILLAADAHNALGESAVAERLWRRALEIDPRSWRSRQRLARHALRAENADGAAEHYRRLLDIADLPRSAFAEAAEFFVSHEMHHDARRAAERFAEAYVGEAVAHVFLASARNALGEHGLARKALDQAELCAGVGEIQDLVTRQRRFAERPEAEREFRRYAALFLDGDAEKAEAGLAGVVAGWPDFWEAAFMRGACLRKLGRLEEARGILEKLRATHDLLGVRKELTCVYGGLGLHDLALETAEAAAAEAPEDAEILANHAAALLEKGRYQEAWKQAVRARELDPDDETVRGLLKLIEARSERRGPFRLLRDSVGAVARLFRKRKA